MQRSKIELGLLGRSLMPLLVVMMMLTLHLVAAPAAQAADGATEASAVVLAAMAGSGEVHPSSVLQGPLAAEGEDWWTSTKSFMSNIIKTLTVVVWFVVAIGVVLLVIAHFAQSVLPDWAQQFKGYLPKGVVLIIVMNVVLTIVGQQLEGEAITGAPTWTS
jgi:hypothetical protein